MPLNSIYHLSPFKLHNKTTKKKLPFIHKITDQQRLKLSQSSQVYNSMNSVTNIENGIGFSQPSFGFEYLSNGMNLEAKNLGLVGNMTYYIGYPSSNPSASYTDKHQFNRSVSCHSLYKGDYEDGAVRRVHSAGDVMGRVDNSVSMSKEYSMIIEGMMKVSRYSPEEKRERIKRYRSKRNLRNFKKKIQYDCRKILADTRRRSKGRFVRNEEASAMTTTNEERIMYNDHLLNDHHKMAGGNEDYGCEENSWINLLDYSLHCQY